MEAIPYDELLRKYRKKPLVELEGLPHKLECGRQDIEKIIPHRSPLLFVDTLSAVDFQNGMIAGGRIMQAADPVFSGHFPEFPVYPGNFTVEMIGQLALCLYYFVNNQRSSIGPDAKPIALRATKMGGALFQEPILPGDEVILLAQKINFDAYFGSMIGQAIVRGKVAVVTIGEVMILED